MLRIVLSDLRGLFTSFIKHDATVLHPWKRYDFPIEENRIEAIMVLLLYRIINQFPRIDGHKKLIILLWFSLQASKLGIL